MFRVFVSILFFLGSLAVVIPSSARPVAAEATSTRVTVTPGLLELETEPGTDHEVAISLHNPSPDRLAIRVAPVGATTAGNGGVGYRADQGGGAASWLALDRDSIELAPGAALEVTGRVHVPAHAPRGDSVLGIAVWVPNDASPTGGEPANVSANIEVQVRQIVPVVVSVPGGGPAHLEATDLVLNTRDDPRLGVSIANGGDLRGRGAGAIDIPDLGIEAPFSVGTILPHEDTTVAVPWSGPLPEGRHRASVTITDDVGRRTTWSGALVVSVAVPDPGRTGNEEAASGPVPARRDDPGRGVWAIGLAGFLGGAGVGALQWWRGRRRHRVPQR